MICRYNRYISTYMCAFFNFISRRQNQCIQCRTIMLCILEQTRECSYRLYIERFAIVSSRFIAIDVINCVKLPLKCEYIEVIPHAVLTRIVFHVLTRCYFMAFPLRFCRHCLSLCLSIAGQFFVPQFSSMDLLFL